MSPATSRKLASLQRDPPGVPRGFPIPALWVPDAPPRLAHANLEGFRYPLKRDVEKDNTKRLHRLPGLSRFYDAHDVMTDPSGNLEAYQKSLMVPTELELRVGALVMYVKNSPDLGLVNGSMGVVVGFRASPDPVPTDTFRKPDLDKIPKHLWPFVSKRTLYPLVRFPIRDTTECYEVLVVPQKWKMQVGRRTMFSRVQVRWIARDFICPHAA